MRYIKVLLLVILFFLILAGISRNENISVCFHHFFNGFMEHIKIRIIPGHIGSTKDLWLMLTFCISHHTAS